MPQQFMVGDIKVDTKAQLDRTSLRLLLDAFVSPIKRQCSPILTNYLRNMIPSLFRDNLMNSKNKTRSNQRNGNKRISCFSNQMNPNRKRSLEEMPYRFVCKDGEETSGQRYETWTACPHHLTRQKNAPKLAKVVSR